MKRVCVAMLFCLMSSWSVLSHGQQGLETDGTSALSQNEARNRAKIHTELASLYLEHNKLAIALDEIRIAVQSDKGYAPAYALRGLIHFQLRDTNAADEDFRQAIALAPNDPEIANNYGWYLCQTNRERLATRFFLNAAKNPLYTTPERAYTNAGACALKIGDSATAESLFHEAIQADAGAALARMHLAEINFLRGNIGVAQELIDNSLRGMSPPTAQALWLGMRIQYRAGNAEARGEYAAALRRLYPNSKEYQDFLKGNYE